MVFTLKKGKSTHFFEKRPGFPRLKENFFQKNVEHDYHLPAKKGVRRR